jgi:hypothetical protein
MRHVALIAVTVAGLAGRASADGFYYSESFGGTKVSNQLADQFEGGLRVHLGLGWRWKNWAAQGFLAIDGNTAESSDGSYGQTPGLFSYGLDLKYLHPVSQHLEVYLRGSVSRGVLVDARSDLTNYSGRGLGIGAGVQLKGKVPALGLLFWPLFFCPNVPGPKITGALFLDDGFEFYRLHPGGKLDATPSIDGTLSHITFGFALGKDF